MMSANTDAHSAEVEARMLLDDMTVIAVVTDQLSADCVNPGTGVAS